jgi:hypothetical protein
MKTIQLLLSGLFLAETLLWARAVAQRLKVVLLTTRSKQK